MTTKSHRKKRSTTKSHMKKRSPKKSLRKSRSPKKSHRKKHSPKKSVGRCEKSNLKKYINRPGPAFPAQNCKKHLKVGNDGNLYRSSPNKNGIYRWVKV